MANVYYEITGVTFSRNKPHCVGRRRINSVEGPLSAGEIVILKIYYEKSFLGHLCTHY